MFGLVVLLVCASISIVQATQIMGTDLSCPIQVREYFLTKRPTQEQVITSSQSQCRTFGQEENFLQCEGEFSGNYSWTQENELTNYVLFDLAQNTLLTKINLTYLISDGRETPKITFCAVPANRSISDTFRDLECNPLQVQPTGNTVVGTLEPSFGDETSKIGMEIITNGIKADFRATRVEFFGSCTTVSTTGDAVSLPGESTSALAPGEASASETTTHLQMQSSTSGALSSLNGSLESTLFVILALSLAFKLKQCFL